MSEIRFGTDGWRALVAEEFTLPNVRAVTQAVAMYFKSHPDPDRPRRIIVGYDTRPLGDRFAESVAEVLAANDFQVLLTEGPLPTPAVSFAIRELRLLGGIVVTASHNPFTYNGLKLKPSYAGPAEEKMTRWIEERLFRTEARRIPMEEALKRGRIRRIDFSSRYLRFLRGYLRWDLLKRAPFRVAYDSMHGAGGDLLQRAVKGSHLQIFSVKENHGPVPSSYRPEPVGEQLRELASQVRHGRFDVGLATDGDADRVGLIDPRGRFVSAQETMALLLWHLLEDRGWRGLVVTTVAGTNRIEGLASCYGVPLKRTPVGFKHIARLMRSQDVLFGGEESGGFGFKGCVPERDGVLAGLLILEMMAMRGKGLSEILADLRANFGQWVYARADLILSQPMETLRLYEWIKTSSGSSRLKKAIPGEIEEIDTLDGLKVILRDGSWLLLRPSGTEPLLRVYSEARNPSLLQRLLRAGRRIGRDVMGH